MIPKVGDIVRLTKEFIEYHKERWSGEEEEAGDWLFKFEDCNILILKTFKNVVTIQREDDSAVSQILYMSSGKFYESGSGPIVFEMVKESLNNSSFCNCGGPFVITGFTSSYKVCTVCHKEQR